MILQDVAKAIRCVVLDIDGVMTDGSIWVGPEGETFKRFDVKDGLGIKLLQAAGIEIAIITGRRSKIVETRAQELGITHVYQGQLNKIAAFEDLLQTLQIGPDAVAYMGDDLPDLPLLMRVALAACPQNATPDVVRVAHLRTHASGGQGAIREFAETLLKIRGDWYPIVEANFLASRS